MINKQFTEVLSLFPQPLFTTIYTGSDLTQTIRFLDRSEMINTGKADEYGLYSKDTYILENPECEPLRNFILECLLYFGKEIMMFDYDKYSFMQSWISHKEPGQHHVMHTHPNSLISGVFYYGEDDPDIPAISFHKPIIGTNVSMIFPKYQRDRRKSQYAWETFSVNYTPGLLLIFPSYVLHSVPTNNSNKIRKSIAFNVQPTGGLGEENSLTELLFKKVM
jgi:uncharacterized protein (TIGR02466 family)